MTSSHSAASVTVAGLIAALAFAGASVAGSTRTPRAQSDSSPEVARVLQGKIDAIQAAENRKGRSPEVVTVTEVELKSYVLYEMRDQIPARIDSLDVQLSDNSVSADTKLTFDPNGTGNAVLDVLVSGTHRLFVKGQLAASEGRGRFQLQEVRLDGIPVPTVLVETIVDKYVKPQYPDVDLSKEFQMPWGIEALTITSGKAAITY